MLKVILRYYFFVHDLMVILCRMFHMPCCTFDVICIICYKDYYSNEKKKCISTAHHLQYNVKNQPFVFI